MYYGCRFQLGAQATNPEARYPTATHIQTAVGVTTLSTPHLRRSGKDRTVAASVEESYSWYTRSYRFVCDNAVLSDTLPSDIPQSKNWRRGHLLMKKNVRSMLSHLLRYVLEVLYYGRTSCNILQQRYRIE